MMKQTEFDRFADNYRKIHNHNLRKTGYTSDFFAERKVSEIARLVADPKQNFNILDLGCGDGLCTAFFRQYFPNSFLQGLDVSGQSIQSAVRRDIPGAQFNIYDGSQIPFKNDSFHIILLAGVLHHVVDVPNQTRLIAECRRVLTKEGSLFVFEHNPLNPITRKIVDDCPFDKNAKLINPIRLKKRLQQNGFQTRCRFIIFLPALLKKFEFLENWIWWVPIGGQYYYICLKKN
ncbi:MAG: class I SAM-dependent methyltransferase [Deltaproteobacteria bacterium]|nr:class I SAM-dependent methyltransferase [Deltaproteobacteria bacterium]